MAAGRGRATGAAVRDARRRRSTPAHETDRLAEMVCSNSFRSDDAEHNAVGLLHQEMRALDSLIMRAADRIACPPDRRWRWTATVFAAEVTRAIERIPTSRRARADRCPARPPGDHRHRAADRVRARRIASPPRPARTPSPSSTPSRRSSTATASTWTSCWMAARWDKGGQGLHQLPDGQAAVRGLRRCADRRREEPSSRSGRRTRPISKAACRSKSWPSAAPKRCATGR